MTPPDLSDGIIRATVGPDSPYLVSQLPYKSEQEGAYAHAEEWDLPSPDVVPRVVVALKGLLAANGLDASRVVVSGYDRFERQSDFEAGKREYTGGISGIAEVQGRISEINAELAQLYQDGILTDSRRQQAREEISGLRARVEELKNRSASKEQRLAYFLSPLAALEEPGNSYNNHSVYYAGGGAGATLGVYDRQAIARLGGDTAKSRLPAKDIHIVDATRSQLEAAKVAELYIYYADYDQSEA